MAFTEKTVYGYTCERCGTHVEAVSPWSDDYPEGYFVTMRRVTEMQNHSISDLLFFDTKDCLVNYMMYGISSSTSALRPITRPETSKRRADRLVRPVTVYPEKGSYRNGRFETATEARARALPRLGPTGSIPLDPDRFESNAAEILSRFAVGDWVVQVEPRELLTDHDRQPHKIENLGISTGTNGEQIAWIDLGAGELFADAFEKTDPPKEGQ